MQGSILPTADGNKFDLEFLVALFTIFSISFLTVYVGVPMAANAFFK